MAIDFAKLLTTGVGSWLGFESACDRSGLFGEKYLATAIGQILAARTGNRAIAEWPHPVLAPVQSGPGRRPEVDFVVRDRESRAILAVESKWAGRTAPHTSAILWDLIRLELIANATGARCLFVLGGTRQRLEAVFNEAAFSDADTRLPPRRPMLRHDNNVLHSTPLVPTVRARIPLLKKLFREHQDFNFPEKIVSRRTAPFPTDPKPRHYQVYTWEIVPATNRRTFRPANSRHYIS
jgi:hypothetical protein